MLNNLPTTDQRLVSISAAAKFLEVSIDTVRRWDKSGILHSIRPDGKNRQFSLEELERVKFSRPMTISEAAHKLGISMSTMRRLEKRGLIESSRDKNGERIYTPEMLEKYLKSDQKAPNSLREDDVLPEPEIPAVDPKPQDSAPVVFDVHEDRDQSRKFGTSFALWSTVTVVFAIVVAAALFDLPEAIPHILKDQTISNSASDILAAIWGFSGWSLATFGGQTSVVQGLTFVFIAGFIVVALFMRISSKKELPIPNFGSRVDFGSLVVLVLSINLGLVGGVATIRVVQRAEAKVQVQDNSDAVLGTQAPKSPQVNDIQVSLVTIAVPEDAYVNVRREPSRTADVVIQITQTVEVAKLGEENGWVKIKTPQSEEGWVSEEFVKDKL